MNIQHNTIVYPAHIVTCDPTVYSRAYVEDIAKILDEESVECTPREHARVLRRHNNDGTWGIKKVTQPAKVGDRVTLVRMDLDPDPISPGAMGTVTNVGRWINNEWHVGVNWDNGRTLALIYPVDTFTVRAA